MAMLRQMKGEGGEEEKKEEVEEEKEEDVQEFENPITPGNLRKMVQYSSLVNILKFCTPTCLIKWHMQTVQILSDYSSLIRVCFDCLPIKYFVE